jgi:hypothetical protein
MTVDELRARFPEIPADLHDEPVLAQLARDCDDLLQIAHKPTACTTEYAPGSQCYLKLIGPMSIYNYGLSTREKVLRQLQDVVEQQQADPAGFRASLLPQGTVATDIRGPGCG